MIRFRLAVPLLGTALILVVFAVVAAVVSQVATAVAAAVLAVAVVGVWWVVSGLVYRSYRWQLTSGTVELRHGVIVHYHQVLPRTRVQNVTQTSGPIARALGLATVTVHSAGANTPNITIPGMATDAGDWLRASLLPAGSPTT